MCPLSGFKNHQTIRQMAEVFPTYSKNMSGPLLFPNLLPRVVDRLWFNVDKPCDDENELSKLEEEHQDWVTERFSSCDFYLLAPLPVQIQ